MYSHIPRIHKFLSVYILYLIFLYQVIAWMITRELEIQINAIMTEGNSVEDN